jgi:adenylate cyclase
LPTNVKRRLRRVTVFAVPDTRPIVEWLADGARSAPQPEQVLAQLCERLVACGIPLWRVAVLVRTLHPQIMGRRFLWRPGAEIEVGEAPLEAVNTRAYRDSPFAHVYATGEAIRRRLADRGCPIDFALLDDLRAEGVTDYLALPLVFSDGAVHVATWTTRQPGGFSDAQAAGIAAIAVPLARVAETRALARTARVLLDTYVGHQAGERILDGHIRRGDVEEIHAAIWLSDMRGFTALADSMPPRELIDLLNRYFDCQVPAIVEHGGEVLKFIGDGLLAIFPVVAGEAGAAAVCRSAVTAAREASSNIAALARRAGSANFPVVRFGLALHLGQVSYGNIGGGNRLDFTCIGPAVNLGARLERLAGQLGRAIVASGEFAGHCPGEFTAIGEFALRGFGATQLVYGLGDEAP